MRAFKVPPRSRGLEELAWFPESCVPKEFDEKAWLYILDVAYTLDNFFSPFLSLYSAVTAGHRNGVEGHKDGVKKAVSVTRAEWRSHARSERDRFLK
jgi:hypothetical protein